MGKSGVSDYWWHAPSRYKDWGLRLIFISDTKIL